MIDTTPYFIQSTVEIVCISDLEAYVDAGIIGIYMLFEPMATDHISDFKSINLILICANE